MPFETEILIENAVDYLLKQQSPVITADAIILDECQSWYNMTGKIIQNHPETKSYISIYEKTP